MVKRGPHDNEYDWGHRLGFQDPYTPINERQHHPSFRDGYYAGQHNAKTLAERESRDKRRG